MRRLALFLASALVLVAAAAPVAAKSGPGVINLPDGFRPEGITSDGGNRFWVGSLANGDIWQGDFRTGQGFVLAQGPGQMAVGTDFEAAHQRLWVAGGGSGQVRVYDVQTGALLQTYQFTSGFLNDLVVHSGAVYVTDSNNANLIVIPLGPGGALPAQADTFMLPLTGDFVLQPGFNLNGITSASQWLIVVQSNAGLLFRVDPETGVTDQIDTGGVSVSAGDGLERQGHTLYVVRNQLNRVAVFRTDADFLSADFVDDITAAGLDIPTTATLANGDLWAVNARFSTPPTPTTDYAVIQLPRKP